MIPYLQINRLTKSFGDLLLFADIAFGIAEGQRIGLIAKNGSGKTTLLNILSGKEDYDSGEIVFRRDLRVGYLKQNPSFPAGMTVWQTCEDSGNELLAKQILTRFQITDLHQKTEELSGGQLKRVALAHVLMTEPDLLILDEPTNHLDLEMIEWLESYLSRSTITLLMVTHDRYFLDRVCNGIIEIDNRQLYSYKGNYNYYLEKRQERIETQNTELERANNLFRKELDWMRRQPQARGTKAKYRIDAFRDLEKKVRQESDPGTVRLNVKASYIGNKIFEARQVSKRFGAICITESFNYTFSRYEKLGIIGNNGTGKTTFIKMIIGEETPDAGAFDIGETVTFGYYSQTGLSFDEKEKVIDVVRNIAEVIDLGNGRKWTASQFLQHFLFPPEKQQDYVVKLSGGEQRRLHLCTVLMKNPNFLILDEPTNDLDIITLNILEEYLAGFKGCVIVVSHDRYFMDKVVDHVWVFKGQGIIRDFPGNYTQYREALGNTIPEAQNPAKKEPKSIHREPVRRMTSKLSFGEKRELETLEKDIPALEAEQAQIEQALSSGHLSNDELLQQSQRISQILEALDAKALRWMELLENSASR
ncbi:MAG: ABC-F family ATP-binding cassette domain-containing protein [Dysgonamonadaceae bacterium]|jgi:ATP-binding cassette subfamily F protein uup|nr:ABC-F family ATP-binding cassette domain-containing protein [Dysgonamonadaceae bacterium]